MTSTRFAILLLAGCALFAATTPNAQALTKEQRDALRTAKGRYKITFNALATLENTMTMEEVDLPISGTGKVKLPKKKGKAPVTLILEGSTVVAFNARITRIKVSRNGKKVSYRGISAIPNGTLGLGDLSGPFRGTVKLKKTKEIFKATTSMSGSPSEDFAVRLSATLKGKK